MLVSEVKEPRHPLGVKVLCQLLGVMPMLEQIKPTRITCHKLADDAPTGGGSAPQSSGAASVALQKRQEMIFLASKNIDYNTTSARLSELGGATPAAQAPGGQMPPSTNTEKGYG